MRSIKNEKSLKGKKILLRLDLNVPLENGKIIDTTRIDKILPTLDFLTQQETKIIVLSDFIDSWSALIDFSLPTNNGTTIEGKITMSLRGKRGFR